MTVGVTTPSLATNNILVARHVTCKLTLSERVLQVVTFLKEDYTVDLV